MNSRVWPGPMKSFVFKSSARPGWCNWRRNFSLIAWYACVRPQIALALRARAILLVFKNVPWLIYSKLHSKSCDYLYLNQHIKLYKTVTISLTGKYSIQVITVLEKLFGLPKRCIQTTDGNMAKLCNEHNINLCTVLPERHLHKVKQNETTGRSK